MTDAIAAAAEADSRTWGGGEDRLGPYRLVEVLGKGAFGTAYLAEDTRLGRQVVVKVLRPRGRSDAARDRMLEEARLASAIDHPNVCAIYEADEHEGRPFIVMQYVRGQTLRRLLERGRLDLRSALSVAVQVADGLAAAHRLGILHRDIKPENVLIAGDGVAKIVDFGLARRKDAFAAGDQAEAAGGRPGSAVGTTAYLAPEQFVLRRSSEQSDVYALGTVLFEMLTGRHPFEQPDRDPVKLATAIQVERPPAPSRIRRELPEAVDELVLRALAKQPTNRYTDARELAEALKGLIVSLELETGLVPGERSATLPLPGAGKPERPGILAGLVGRLFPGRTAAAQQRTIAVLPFRDRTSAGRTHPHGFTLGNALAARLARVPGLMVRPLSAFLTVSHRRLDASEVGRELGAGRVLTGELGWDGDARVVEWQLLDTGTRALRAGGTVRLPARDMTAAQERVAEQILAALRAAGELPREPASGDIPLTSLLEDLPGDVRHDFLAARALLVRFTQRAGTREDLDRARAAYARVLERAPDFAPAHAGLGTVWLRWARNGFGGVEELRLAERHLARALELDPTLAEAKLYRASTMIWAGQKDGARLALQDLLLRDPDDADTLLAAAVILQLDGLLDEALRLQARALRCDPAAAPRAYYYRARVLLFQRRTEAARREVERGLAVEPGHTLLRHVLGLIQLGDGDAAAAIETLEGVRSVAPTLRILHPALATAYHRIGRRADAAALITDELLDAAAADAETAARVAMYWAAVSDVEQAIHWLRRAIYLGNENGPWLVAGSEWEPLRGMPEFRQLLADLENAHRVNRLRWAPVLEALPAWMRPPTETGSRPPSRARGTPKA